MFQEQRENDEAQILDSPYGVDLNSHVDVFYAILRQVRLQTLFIQKLLVHNSRIFRFIYNKKDNFRITTE